MMPDGMPPDYVPPIMPATRADASDRRAWWRVVALYAALAAFFAWTAWSW
jgi:hypothetical protein